jgi:hypothetical protein
MNDLEPGAGRLYVMRRAHSVLRGERVGDGGGALGGPSESARGRGEHAGRRAVSTYRTASIESAWSGHSERGTSSCWSWYDEGEPTEPMESKAERMTPRWFRAVLLHVLAPEGYGWTFIEMDGYPRPGLQRRSSGP